MIDEICWVRYRLLFRRAAGTSRGVMRHRDVWFVFGGGRIGECAPLPGLSLDDFGLIEDKLDEVCSEPRRFLSDLSLLKEFPSIRSGLEMLLMDDCRQFDPIPINGLIWMGDPEFMEGQVSQKLAENWQCIKMKIGAVGFEDEVAILERIAGSGVELRVDANGAFDAGNVRERLQQLAHLGLHSIEQPVMPGQWELLAEICETSPVPIALDEELIPLVRDEDRAAMLDIVQPQYLVLKPSLLGGFSEAERWIELARQRGIGWWVTSALESNVGLEAIAGWVSRLDDLHGFQGLGTGLLFSNNIPSPVKIENSCLVRDDCTVFGDVRSFVADWLSPKATMELQTSGSTGMPKTISVDKRLMRNSACMTGLRFGLRAGDSALLCLPMQYVAAKMMVVRALVLGLELKVVEPAKVIQESADFAAMVPLQLENSLEYIGGVRTLLVGGAPVSEVLSAKLQGVDTAVYETYGMTETLTHVAVRRLNGSDKSDFFEAIGDIRFDIDERGCLVIFAPELNPEPVVTTDVVDLVDKRRFRWLGRYDNVINSGGVKIFPEVVERKLCGAFGDRRYFVGGRPDDVLGERVVLFVEGKAGEIVLPQLERYEEPREIVFVEKFEETVSGKIRRGIYHHEGHEGHEAFVLFLGRTIF